MNSIKEFISVIGRRRFFILLFFIAVNALLGGYFEKVQKPAFEETTKNFAIVQAERSRLQKEIVELPIKHAVLVRNERRYDDLQKKGFFSPQDRIVARGMIDTLRSEAGVRNISYKIEPISNIDNEELSYTSDQLVSSKMNITMKGLTDREIRYFLDRIQTKFKGLIIAKEYKFLRAGEVDKASLTRLSEKEPVDFITGELGLEWYNIIPRASTESQPLNQAFEGTTP